MSQTPIFLDDESIAMLDATAMASTTSRNDALEEAIHNYVEYDQWVQNKVQKGLQAARDGQVYTEEEVQEHSKALFDKLSRQRTLQ